MARDYFADIDPPSPENGSGEYVASPPSREPSEPAPERSIRNIPITTRPMRAAPLPPQGMKVGAGDIRAESASRTQPLRRKSIVARILLWVLALVSLAALCAAGYFLLLGKTTVIVTPRSHLVTFDASTHFTAYPSKSAAAGTLSYEVQSSEYEDSAVVPANGTESTSERATGTITVFNDFSTSAVRLIKNTRFESPDGHVFRIPSSAEIPGKKGTSPGQVTITVFADQPGPAYNIAPVNRFTLPGLKGSEEFKHVYATSKNAFTGGFSGTRPAVASSTLAAARSEVRSRLEQKAKDSAKSSSDVTFSFPNLLKITFESMPNSQDTSGVRVHEKAIAWMPVFSKTTFSKTIAQSVTADAGTNSISLVPKGTFSATPVGELPSKPTNDPVTFTLSGSGLLVWNVDAAVLAQALAGRDQNAFETIIGGYPGVEKAQANIMPFWKKTFPEKATDIKVTIVDPAESTK